MIMISSLSYGQNPSGNADYIGNNIKLRKVVPYPPLREADVMLCNRVHRIIDTREKMNVVMNWPKNPLSIILFNAITIGNGSAPIPAYVVNSDSLATQMDVETIIDKFSYEIVTTIIDPYDENSTIDTVLIVPIFAEEAILKYEVMEDWIFDKQRSMYFPRIVAIAPMYQPYIGGVKLDRYYKLCWIKWEDVKSVLVNQEVFNRQNDAMRLSYLDFFELRMFSSYIVKKSNVFDNYIQDYEEFQDNSYAAILESDKIKNSLFEWEHDLWEW